MYESLSRRCWSATILFLLLVGGARAQDRLDISDPLTSSGSVSPGSSSPLVFSGTLTAPDTNSYTLSFTDISANPDDSGMPPYFTVEYDDYGGPFTLAPGENYAGPLFGVTARSGTPINTYTGFFTISGSEQDSNGATINFVSNTARFSFMVVAPVPEPSACTSLGLGTLALAGLIMLRRRAGRAAS